MNNRTIRRKVISYFVGVSIILSTVFAAMALVFSYEVEDRLFQTLLQDEQHLIETQLKNAQPPEPRLPFINYHQSTDTLPESIASTLIEEPHRIEFSGDNGKHYHLLNINTGYLVAEVSDHLVVRKLRAEMLSLFLILLILGLFTALLLAFASLKLAKKLLKPLDELMIIVNNAPVDKLPTQFAHRFEQGEIGLFAHTLEKALERIRAFIRREQEFTRDVSHELRTPIAVVEGAVTLLKRTSLNEEQQVVAERIAQANIQMAQSIDGLLFLAREEPQGSESTTVLPLVERIALTHIGLIENKPVTLSINIDAKKTVNASEQALTLILSNLIKNAFIHTHQGDVTINFVDNTLTIRDSGTGVEHSIKEHIFAEGVKGSQSTGSGLGLAIVKRVCDKLQLGLQLQSDTNGTCIRIKFG